MAEFHFEGLGSALEFCELEATCELDLGSAGRGDCSGRRSAVICDYDHVAVPNAELVELRSVGDPHWRRLRWLEPERKLPNPNAKPVGNVTHPAASSKSTSSIRVAKVNGDVQPLNDLEVTTSPLAGLQLSHARIYVELCTASAVRALALVRQQKLRDVIDAGRRIGATDLVRKGAVQQSAEANACERERCHGPLRYSVDQSQASV